MPETIRVDRQRNVIIIDSYGDVAKSDLSGSLQSVLRIAREEGVNKVMVDARRQNSLASIGRATVCSLFST